MKCDILDFDLNEHDIALKSVILRQKNRIARSISKFLGQHTSRQHTEKASQCQLPAAHPLHEPYSHQGERKVGPRGRSGQPDGLLDIANARHLQNGRAVVPESKKEEVKAKLYPHISTGWCFS